MYDYSSDSPVLSVIARGRGLLEGGVELDCIDTGTTFSLSVSINIHCFPTRPKFMFPTLIGDKDFVMHASLKIS